MAILQDSHSAPLDEAIILALGGNLAGDYPSLQALLEAAVLALPSAGLRVLRRSRWWRSAAWPDPAAPAYLNSVALIETGLSPRAALAAALDLEGRFGRRRSAANAPRTLDIDVVAYGRLVVDEPGLTLPHPRAHERRFVMGPLAEITPRWVHPLLRRTAAQLAKTAPIGKDAAPVT